MFKHMRGLNVMVWGRRVGVIVPDVGSHYAFQYDPAFVRTGLELSPFMMPLSNTVYHTRDFEPLDRRFWQLPGLLADALPDAFGNNLINAWMQRNGIPVGEISALDRLAYVGSRALGALSFEPEWNPHDGIPTALDMRRLVEEARAAANSDLAKLPGDDALREILRVGTSAGGAQAKAVVGWNRTTDTFVVGDGELPNGFEHWIIKFTPRELPDAGIHEFAVHEKARAAGIEMSESRLVELDGIPHFMTKRFDRNGARRDHIQTLCALRHLTQNSPTLLLTYDALFETAAGLGLGYGTAEEIFRRMAFNVVMREMDDHTKNFSFRMNADGQWALAPAYDLTAFHFSPADPARFDWENRHALSVNGKFSNITDADLRAVADRHGIGTADHILERIKDVCLTPHSAV